MNRLNGGDVCDPKSSACDPRKSLDCDPVSKRCVAVTFVAAGQPCGPAVTAPTTCAAGSRCSYKLMNSLCIAPADDGQACDGTNSIDCLSPATCINNVCVIQDPAICR
jgi:hypothetical protein